MSAALEVNGCRVNATRTGSDYWVWFGLAHASTGRIKVLKATIGGNLYRVECDDKDHAQWLKETFEANGISGSALKVLAA